MHIKIHHIIVVIACTIKLSVHGELAQSDIWAVVTSINYPTPALTKLVESGLHVVVVADKKTPTDWECPGCQLLSVQKQSELHYAIIKYLPWNHYCRKNIGYLYAIEHGAHIIYDTDDDNILNCDKLSVEPVQCADMLACSAPNHVVNPYAFFGQKTVWPRGFPLEYIRKENMYTMIKQACRPLIQQGLVDNDPDVDAIFRLTREMPIFFTSNEPISLQPYTMAPFNSQNTVFHYDAFWGLAIPVSAAFRVSDIWRGYWVQRLLWDINGNLCFEPARVIQERNMHNFFKDYQDETDLYCKAGSLISFLNNWKSAADNLFQEIIQLHQDLVTYKFFGPIEVDFIKAWLADLTNIGYQHPTLLREK